MHLDLKRIYKGNEYTIGKLYIDGEYFCDTLEDPVRDMDSIDDKIPTKTAIPAGIYKITMNVVSPKYSKRNSYQFCQGRVPRLLNVPFFDGILIHIGNTVEDSSGCILVGENKIKGKVINSTTTFINLWLKMERANRKKESIDIEIC